ncbi:FkbM family methyltransferase [Dolichospermum circinale]|uniref:FkbM family methyltransferase n=1 Tax=Dolichospermum circinale TaxID=109265 RepID=UPI00232D0350|nr:FkbM family methyltransferase [Dolichospermum circinale]MDB9467029.1 FkbM family methyltransferase [Dolichospermum circinale CS-539/09]MDB9472348.1 FkbM family methyltransferase [Dolichospermum circinale CS-539]
MRPVNFNDKQWRRLIPVSLYQLIHQANFRGSTRLKNFLALHPLDPENWVSKVISHFAVSNTIFIDIGAQHGRHFLALLESSKANVLVLACEANKDLVIGMERKMQNAIHSGNLHIFHTAVLDYVGQTEFFVNTQDSGYSGLIARDIKKLEEYFQPCNVNVTTIDEIYKGYQNPVSVIKMDVEGAEFKVLKGACNCIKINKPIIIFECANNAAPFYDYNLYTLLNWFHKIDYLVSTINGVELNDFNSQHIFQNNLCHDFVAYHKLVKPQVELQLKIISAK